MLTCDLNMFVFHFLMMIILNRYENPRHAPPGHPPYAGKRSSGDKLIKLSFFVSDAAAK
jgi:hypothetical protein